MVGRPTMSVLTASSGRQTPSVASARPWTARLTRHSRGDATRAGRRYPGFCGGPAPSGAIGTGPPDPCPGDILVPAEQRLRGGGQSAAFGARIYLLPAHENLRDSPHDTVDSELVADGPSARPQPRVQFARQVLSRPRVASPWIHWRDRPPSRDHAHRENRARKLATTARSSCARPRTRCEGVGELASEHFNSDDRPLRLVSFEHDFLRPRRHNLPTHQGYRTNHTLPPAGRPLHRRSVFKSLKTTATIGWLTYSALSWHTHACMLKSPCPSEQANLPRLATQTKFSQAGAAQPEGVPPIDPRGPPPRGKHFFATMMAAASTERGRHLPSGHSPAGRTGPALRGAAPRPTGDPRPMCPAPSRRGGARRRPRPIFSPPDGPPRARRPAARGKLCSVSLPRTPAFRLRRLAPGYRRNGASFRLPRALRMAAPISPSQRAAEPLEAAPLRS